MSAEAIRAWVLTQMQIQALRVLAAGPTSRREFDGRVMKRLLSLGMVIPHVNGRDYEITEAGCAFLRGEFEDRQVPISAQKLQQVKTILRAQVETMLNERYPGAADLLEALELLEVTNDG